MALESFFPMCAKPLVEDSPTWKLHQPIDWEAISRKLKGLYRREQTHGCGPEPNAPLPMFNSCWWASCTVCPLRSWNKP